MATVRMNLQRANLVINLDTQYRARDRRNYDQTLDVDAGRWPRDAGNGVADRIGRLCHAGVLKRVSRNSYVPGPLWDDAVRAAWAFVVKATTP